METRESTSQSSPTEPTKRDAVSSPSSSAPPILQAPGDEADEAVLPSLNRIEEPTKRYKIFNKTPRRIAIPAKQSNAEAESQSQYLVISPFSAKVLSADTIGNYDYQRWEREDLIDVNEVVAPGDDSQSYMAGCGFWLLVYLAIALLVPSFRTDRSTWIIFAGSVLIILILAVRSAGGFKDFLGTLRQLWQGTLQVINLSLFLMMVFGLGLGLLYLFSGGKDWITAREFTMEGLSRVIQYLFLTIATLLPALMYFLFNRRQREKVQENFIREVLRLDPGVRTITEAESKYLSLVQETFGTSHASAFLFSSGLPILLCTLLIFMGWLLVLQPFTVSSPINIQQMENLLLPRANAVTFAFLGAYFFAINLVFRCYLRADLTPKSYTHIILRLLLAIILAWILSALPVFTRGDATEAALPTAPLEAGTAQPGTQLPAGEVITPTPVAEPAATPEPESANATNGEAGKFSTGLLYLLAFFIGIFPETGGTVLRDLIRNPLFTRAFPRMEEDHPLTRLDGINLYDRSRFMEEGIENIENLAHHNLISLMLSTRISTSRLVDMFDQAILYLHLGLEPDEVAKTRKKLRAYGIRTATDLEAAHQYAEVRGQDELQKFLKILDDENAQPTLPSRIQTILDTLWDDDWMTYLRNWRELNQHSTQTFTLEGVALIALKESEQQAMAEAH